MLHRSFKVLIIGFIVLLSLSQGIAAADSGGLKTPPLPPSLPPVSPTIVPVPEVTPTPEPAEVPAASPGETGIAQLMSPPLPPALPAVSSPAVSTGTVSMDMYYQRPAPSLLPANDIELITPDQECVTAEVNQTQPVTQRYSTLVGDGGSSEATEPGIYGPEDHQQTIIRVAESWIGQIVSFFTGSR